MHWASWENLCFPYEEGGAGFRRLLDICKAFTVKQWWNLRTTNSLWSEFLLAKYCQRIHPVKKRWYSGNSHSWNAMCKLKSSMDQHILWKIGRGDVSMWLDNWTGLGAMWQFFPDDRKPRNLKLSDFLVNGQWQWGAWDIFLPGHVIEHIFGMNINLIPEVDDKPIWTPEHNGIFTVASAWHLLRQRREKNWIDTMTLHNKVPFKMNFTLWRILRDKIPTDTRLAKMGIEIPSRCDCCINPQVEDIYHMSCSGDFAKGVWEVLCGPMGIPCNNIPLRLLLKFWWSWKIKNPILDMLLKCLPAVTMWEIWKARCGKRYGKEAYNITKTINNISFILSQVIGKQFEKVKLKPDWKDIALLMISNISSKKSVMVRWLKPSISFVKINSDGSCKEGDYGGGGIIRDHMGHLIFAYSLRLGQGSSNWAEAKALLFGVNWCIDNGYDMILAESDSKLLVECVNDLNQTPWRILKEVFDLKAQMENTGFILQHCYREANKVADKLAFLSFAEPHNKAYDDYVDLPAAVRGLMTMDRWGLANCRFIKKKEERAILGTTLRVV